MSSWYKMSKDNTLNIRQPSTRIFYILELQKTPTFFSCAHCFHSKRKFFMLWASIAVLSVTDLRFSPSEMWLHVVQYKFTSALEEHNTSIFHSSPFLYCWMFGFLFPSCALLVQLLFYALKMEVLYSSKMPVYFYQTTQCHITEYRTLHSFT
jgi:hypothetical protein